MPDKEAKKPEYERSLLTLRGINAIEEERRIALKKLFELFDNCMKDIVAELLGELQAYLESVQDAFAKQSTSDGFRQKIYDFLYDDSTGLPADTYTEDDIDLLTDELYQHFSNDDNRSASVSI